MVAAATANQTPDDNPRSDLEKQIHLAAVVRSASGRHLQAIREATDFEIDIQYPGMFEAMAGGGTSGGIFEAEASIELHGRFTIRENAPLEMLKLINSWMRQLNAISERVSQMSPEPLLLSPRAHIIRDLTTGEEVGGGPFYDLEQGELLRMRAETGYVYSIVTGSLSEFPAQQTMFEQIVSTAIDQATRKEIDPT